MVTMDDAAGRWQRRLRRLGGCVRGTPLHPQWLTDRFHLRARRGLRTLQPGRVLDVGAGDADTARWLPAGCGLVRIDYPGTNRRYRQRPDVYADALALPVADGAADVVLLMEVLEHLADDRAALAEAARVLRPGGRLVLTVPFLYPLHDAPHDYRRYTRHALPGLLAAHGLAPEAFDVIGNPPLVVAQLANLALLELADALLRRSRPAGLVAVALIWPVTVLTNLLAAPWLLLGGRGRSHFGYRCVAVRGG